MQMVEHMKSNLLQTLLQTRCDGLLAFGQRLVWRARWSKRVCKLIRKNSADDGRPLVPVHVDPFRMVAKVVEIQKKLSARFSAYDVAKLIHVARLSIRRPP